MTQEVLGPFTEHGPCCDGPEYCLAEPGEPCPCDCYWFDEDDGDESDPRPTETVDTRGLL